MSKYLINIEYISDFEKKDKSIKIEIQKLLIIHRCQIMNFISDFGDKRFKVDIGEVDYESVK